MEVFIIKFTEIDYSEDRFDREHIETFYNEIDFKKRLSEIKGDENRFYVENVRVYSGSIPRID